MGFFSDILGIPWKLSRVFSGDLFKDVESIYTALERDSLSLEVNNLKLARLAGREAETERRRRRGGVQRRRPQGRNSKRRRHRREGRSIISGWFASGTAGMHPTAAAAAISCFSLCSIAGDAQCQIALPTPDTRTKYYFYVIYTFSPPPLSLYFYRIFSRIYEPDHSEDYFKEWWFDCVTEMTWYSSSRDFDLLTWSILWDIHGMMCYYWWLESFIDFEIDCKARCCVRVWCGILLISSCWRTGTTERLATHPFRSRKPTPTFSHKHNRKVFLISSL